MEIPPSVKIGAHTFKVSKLGGFAVDDNFGKVEMAKLEMFIRDDAPQSLQEETLIHEAMHVIRQLCGLALKDEDEEEFHVQSISHLVYLFLKENDLLK